MRIFFYSFLYFVLSIVWSFYLFDANGSAAIVPSVATVVLSFPIGLLLVFNNKLNISNGLLMSIIIVTNYFQWIIWWKIINKLKKEFVFSWKRFSFLYLVISAIIISAFIITEERYLAIPVIAVGIFTLPSSFIVLISADNIFKISKLSSSAFASLSLVLNYLVIFLCYKIRKKRAFIKES